MPEHLDPQGDGDIMDEWAGAGGEWDEGGYQAEINNIHAQHVTAVTSQATSAAWHADIAAKQAAQLAQWVQYLWRQVAQLQSKVTELEDWKKKTLEEMNKIRTVHRTLRKQVLPEGDEEDLPPVPKAKSLPLLLADSIADPAVGVAPGHLPSAKRKPNKANTVAVGPPPGLALDDSTTSSLHKKSVSFVGQAAFVAPGPVPSSDDPPIGVGRSVSTMSAVSAVSETTSPMTDAGDGVFEGVQVDKFQVDDIAWERAEWRIGHLSSKLKGCMGRALVSSPFTAWGLDDLRLMIFPDGKEVAKGPRSKRQKDQYTKKVTEGPLDGCLKLKVPECPPPHILEYYLTIGSVRKGPFKHNFQESTVNGCSDFGVDWLQCMDADQNLRVTVEIHRVGGSQL